MSLAMLTLASVLQKPATDLAARLIYPGSRIDSSLLKRWQAELEAATQWRELGSIATRLLSSHAGHPIEVSVSPSFIQTVLPTGLVSYRAEQGWTYDLKGWDTAEPGVVRMAEVFGTLLVAVAGRLEQALSIAGRETEMLKERHLAELGRLSATVAHEMRNPLNIISMASASCDNETKKEISEQLDRAGRLINDLLAYSGKLQIEKKTLSLKEEIDYILAHYPGNTIQVDVAPATTLPADSHRLHQVFFNLLDNAFAALKGRDGGRILINAEQKEDKIKISVCDNGPGIPENMREEIFQPFISGRIGGTGLGLAIVRRIMQAHGGRVELGKMDGWGCCFDLYFPVQS